MKRAALRANAPADLLRALRPAQWTKNAVVLAAFFFALGDRAQHVQLAEGLLRIIPAVLVFCLVSSAVYLLNDILDADADRRHPRKRDRPIAAGRVSVPAAALLAVALGAAGLLAAWRLEPRFAAIVGLYLALQLAYCTILKRLALVDVFVIAAGFVLRAVGGAVALRVGISVWLLLCAFLLALFLALCKRRQEKVVSDDGSAVSRSTLAGYDERLLDQLIAIVAAVTIVCYAIYTFSPATVDKFGTACLGLTIPFVMFGIFRYLDLVYRHDLGERPERVLFTDLATLVNLGLYAGTVLGVFLLRDWPGWRERLRGIFAALSSP